MSGPTFFLHKKHVGELTLDCTTCHLTENASSVKMVRPGHEQCMTCHGDAFEKKDNPKICAQCHTGGTPSSATKADLQPFPLYKKKRAILIDFSHAKHVDARARVNPKTGFRADCTFCHKFQENGVFATFPGHTECASCHGKEGMRPRLTPTAETKECRGCHSPEEIENPGFTKTRKLADHVVSGVHVNIKFSHVAHFKERDKFNLQCTTCHYTIPASTSLADLNLPKMLDCVQCHDSSKDIAEQFKMNNCQTCHSDQVGGAAPGSHTRFVKPSFHTEVFRRRHETEAYAPGAKCFVCHTNVQPANNAQAAKTQCQSCHLVMKPVSHTVTWGQDVHGKFAALDKTACAQCHTNDQCTSCHNQVPRSHQPLGPFANGGHAMLARLDERACLTCHTFADKCAECHRR